MSVAVGMVLGWSLGVVIVIAACRYEASKVSDFGSRDAGGAA